MQLSDLPEIEDFAYKKTSTLPQLRKYFYLQVHSLCIIDSQHTYAVGPCKPDSIFHRNNFLGRFFVGFVE